MNAGTSNGNRTNRRIAAWLMAGLLGIEALHGVAVRAAGGNALAELVSFSFNSSNGANPSACVVQGSDGNFYGTTDNGGASNEGTVYRITPSGTPTQLYSFSGGSDGGHPYASLVQGSDGNFYGTTFYGGASGAGTIFRITSSGTFTTLYSFSYSDGANPYAGLVQGSDGNFYGTTLYGGVSSSGTVYSITSSGTLTTLYSFNSYDGYQPYAGLVQGSDGNFYGATYAGGASGHGTVYRITPSGTFTTLYTFSGNGDGSGPPRSLVLGADGNFYGTAEEGGASGYGTVFRITSSGTLTTLYSFTGLGDGGTPAGTLVQGNDGNFYGTTIYDGASGYGTVFRIAKSGALNTVYTFSGGSDGANPYAGLIQGRDGVFHGTAYHGGTSGDGTVFRLSLHGDR